MSDEELLALLADLLDRVDSPPRPLLDAGGSR